MMFSLEMTRLELAERILADDCGFELRQFTQTGLSLNELQEIESGLSEYDRWPFAVSDWSTEDTRTLRAKAKLQKASFGLVQPADIKAPRRLQLTQITADLKRIAKELDCCVILLTQLNADAEGREPDDTHYWESKQILQDADVAMLAHRETKTDSDFLLKITKNRRGKPGQLRLHVDGAYQRFTDPQEHEVVGETWQGGPI